MPGAANRNRAVQAGQGQTRRCPICGKPQDHVFQPFCSKRCANVDLGRWLGGHYVIPGEAIGTEGEEDRPPGEDEH